MDVGSEGVVDETGGKSHRHGGPKSEEEDFWNRLLKPI